MSIQTRNISKQFGDFTALHDISLDFGRGELTALLGPSGCGKTTLLRIIAGLEHADRGSILLDGQDVSARHPRERQVGFVFQHYALFKHMNVFENVAFGLRVKPRGARPDEATIRSKVKSLLELVQLDTLGLRFPSELSGGQRQRIALARALAVEPRVLLLDEPFGALDASVRKQLRRWLRELHEEIHVTTIFVTHDQEEALEVADRLVIVNRGRIEQTGAPQEVYDRPATPFVYGFLGDANRLHGQLQDGAFDAGSARFDSHAAKGQPAGPALGFARPHEIDLERYATGASGMLVQLQRAQAIGPLARLELLREDTDELIEVVMPAQRYAQLQFKPGEMLVATPRRLQVFADLHASHGSQA